ncbi:MAG: hypothetical protein ACR2FM_01805 [Candidatus Saccharimonadales bacterium]
MAIQLSPEVLTQNTAIMGIIDADYAMLVPSSAEGSVLDMPQGIDCALGYEGYITGIHKLANRYGVNPNNTENEIIAASIGKQAALGLEEVSETDFAQSLLQVVPHIRGSFSLMVRYKDELFVTRDRNDEHSVFFGTLQAGGFAITSLFKAMQDLKAEGVTELRPGTLARFEADAIHTTRWAFQ